MKYGYFDDDKAEYVITRPDTPTSWNDLFRPSVILTSQSKYTLPIMVSLLNGDIYKREHGAIYVGLSLTALPLIVVYFILAKYIVAGVALGSVKG